MARTWRRWELKSEPPPSSHRPLSPPSLPPVALVLMMRTCLNIVTCNTWLVLFFFFCEVLFSMLNTVTLFCMCLCFCKNHIYFTIFVDKKKKTYLILIVFFYLNRTIIRFIYPAPSPTSCANYVQTFCSETRESRHQ